MIDTQHGIAIMGGREVSRPYQVCFSSKASGFYPWGNATALAGEGGVGDVVCLIQASASNHKPKQTKGTVLSVCYKERVDTVLWINTGGTETKNIKNSLLATPKG